MRREALRPAIAGMLAASLLGGVAVISLLNRNVLRELAPRLSPPVLVARAQDVIRSLGYENPPADSAYWFTWKSSYREQASDRDATFRVNEGDPPRTSRLRFVYRQSPGPLLGGNLFGRVLYRDPPAEVPGMVDVNLDAEGRLLRLCAVPGILERRAGSLPPRPNWGPILDRAGLQPDDLSPVPPLRTPPVPYDLWAEWEMLSNRPGEYVRITAAAFDGRPVYFDVDPVQPHSFASRASDDARTISRLTSDPTTLVVSFAVGLVSAVLIARHRLLLGQADRRGASRLALYFFSLNLIGTVLWPDHVSHLGEEYFLVARCLAWGLYWSATGAVFYLAFEPSVRRRWPAMLIGWNRVLAGRLRDPIVGRDIIVGTVAGTAMVGVMWLAHAMATWLDVETVQPFRPALEAFREPRHVAALVIFLHASTLAVALGLLFMLLVLRRLLRVKWLALAVWIVVFAAIALHTFILSFDWRISLPAGLAGATMAGLALDRFGLVALCATIFTSGMLTRLPAALEFSAWYADRSLISLGIVVAIGLYGARTAVGGQGSAHRI